MKKIKVIIAVLIGIDIVYIAIRMVKSISYGYMPAIDILLVIAGLLLQIIFPVLEKVIPQIKETPRFKLFLKFILPGLSIIILIVLTLWTSYQSRPPEIIRIESQELSASEEASSFRIQLFTNHTTNHVILFDNGEQIAEIDQYTQDKGKRTFSATVHLDPEERDHLLSASILLPDGSIIESDESLPVTIPLTLKVTYGEYTGNDPYYIFVGTNVQFDASTNRRVLRIDMEWVNPQSGPCSDTMKTDDGTNWTFYAIFKEEGDYSIRFIVTDDNGETVEKNVNMTWPLSPNS